jgi:hypothetical protein
MRISFIRTLFKMRYGVMSIQKLLFVTVVSILFINFSGCKKKRNHANTTWRIIAEISDNYKPGKHAAGLLSDGPTHTVYTGTFRIPEKPREKGLYDIEQLSLGGTIQYLHRPDIGEGYHCEGHSGTCNENQAKMTGIYWSHDEPNDFLDNLPGPLPYDPGQYTPFGFQIIISPLYSDIDTSQLNPCTFTYPCTSDEGTTWTAYGTPPFLDTYYLGEATNRTVFWTTEDERNISTYVIHLECVSNCGPKEDEECDPEETLNLCREARQHILSFCRTLEDWMVVEQYEDSEPLITCENSDCTGAIQANEGNAPWIGITEHYSSACDELAGDVACSVECFGWGESLNP